MLNEYKSDWVSNLQAYKESVKTPNRYCSIQNTKEKRILLNSEENSLNQFRELNTQNNEKYPVNN